MIRLIFLTDFTETFSHNLLHGILQYSKGREPWVVCRMPLSFKQYYGLSGVLDWALKWQADAIIGQFESHDDVSIFKQHGIIAMAQDFKSRFLSIPNIVGMDKLIGQMAADFFLGKGFRHFAFIGYMDAVWSEERGMGFQERLLMRGVPKSHIHVYRKHSLDYCWHYDYEPLARWINTLPRQLALLACDDTQANKILEVCRVLGILIPEEIAVLGVDNDDLLSQHADPPLSSVSVNIERGGYEAAQLIERSVRWGEEIQEDVVIRPIDIVNRLSTDIYATEDPAILTAIKYIHQHLADKLHVDEITRQVPLSRRLLEIKFKKVTGTSIYQYITDLRMNRFARLLLAGDEPIADLALQVGMPDAKNLSRWFKKRKGCTPQAYRMKNKLQ